MKLHGLKTAAVCTAVSLLLLAGCGKSAESDSEGALSDKVLKAGIIVADDSFAEKEEEKLKGLEPDILNLLGEKLEVSVEYTEAANEDELLKLLDDGSIEIACGRLPLLSEMEEKYTVSGSYAKTGIYIVSPKGRYMDSLASLYSESIGVSPSVPSHLVLEIPNANKLDRKNYDSLSKMKQDLLEGTVKAIICTEREAVTLVKSGDVQASEIAGGPRVRTVFYMAKGENNLCANINGAINLVLDERAKVE